MTAEYGRDTGAMTIVYVITYGDATHGTGIYGVTLDAEEAMYMAKEAEQHYHKCYGGPICEPRDWPNEGQWSREVFIREYKARPPGEQFDGDDTELRAVFGEPVEGRDFTRIDGEATP